MKKILTRDLPGNMQTIRTLSFSLLETVNLTFNQSWFFNLAEDFPVSINDLHALLDGLERDAYFYPDLKRLTETCEILENMSRYARRFILPCLREKLGISCLTSTLPDKKTDKYIQASFIAYAFPVNLQKMESLLQELTRQLVFTSLPAVPSF